MREQASYRRRSNRPITEIVEFRLHLDREGITLAEFHRRQSLAPAPDMTGEALTLARRRIALNRKGL